MTSSKEYKLAPGSSEAAPSNLVHIALWHLDPTMLTSPDGKRIEVNLDAICKLLSDPPPMLRARDPG